jgi:multidrug resistance efflux pump
MLKIELPRKEADLKEATAKAVLALDKARSTLPLTLAQKRQALSKARHERDKLAEKMKHWQKDRSALTVTAPVEGIVYYGRCVQGQWSTAAEMAKKLQRGGALGAEEVFMTVVQPRPLFVRAMVEEKDLPLVAGGTAAKVTALVLPDQPLSAKVEQVSAVPLVGGQYDVRLSVELSEHAEKALQPGMTCTVKVQASTQP